MSQIEKRGVALSRTRTDKMNEHYYYAIDGNRNGPVSFDDLPKIIKARVLSGEGNRMQ